MSFSVWFKNWIIAFCKLMTFDYKKPKSDAQRKRERERRMRNRFSSANKYRSKKKYKRRRSSSSVQNEKLLKGLFGFIGASLGILLLPLGLFDWGWKIAKAKKTSIGKAAIKKAALKHKFETNASQLKKGAAHPLHSSVNSPGTHTTTNSPAITNMTQLSLLKSSKTKDLSQTAETSTATEPDENTPKSIPKNEKDQYIRKRMIIAGSYYCDKAVLDSLKVGSLIDLEAEPDNLYDKDAVRLLFNGQKIGYVAKKDRMAFLTCLKLKRKIYGVITEIVNENGQVKYEYETWFDSAL